MRPVVESGPGRWMVAAGVAVVVMGAFVWLVGRSSPLPSSVSIRPVSEVRPTVKIARPDESDTLLKEEAELRDLRPLFLPTERNARLPDPKREPGRTMLDGSELKTSGSDSEFQLGADLPPVELIGGKLASQAGPAAAFEPETGGTGLPGFGRRAVSEAPSLRRTEVLEVTRWSDGQRVQTEELEDVASPRDARPWNPVEFMAVVDRAGLATPLVVTEGSGVEEVDQHFRNYLTQSYRIGERLEPGTYRIVVAP